MRFMFTWLQSFLEKEYLSIKWKEVMIMLFKLKLHNVQTILNDIKIVYKRVH